MATTYEAIATVTVGSGGAASIEFTSIPATFTDLAIKASLRSDTASYAFEFIKLTFNNNTSNDYSSRYVRGNGASASSSSVGPGNHIEVEMVNGDTATASTFGSSDIYIPNYGGSAAKSISSDSVSENNNTTAYASLLAGITTATSAITSIKLTPSLGSNWKQYSTATLYGIKNS